MIGFRREGDAVVATSEVPVGVRRVTLSVTLVGWRGDLPDVAGLRGSPVVIVPDDDAARVAAAGISRSGRTDPVIHGATSHTAARLLTDLADGTREVAVVVGGSAGALDDVRALGGRPLPALPLDDADATRDLLGGASVDVDVALPAGDDAMRAAARAALEVAGGPSIHHVVEVDPRAAFDGAVGDASLTLLAAGAAGVLAGRVAVGNRRWRA